MVTGEVRTKIAAEAKKSGFMEQTVYASILEDGTVEFNDHDGDYIVKNGYIEWERIKIDNVIYRGDNGSFAEYEIDNVIGFPYVVYNYRKQDKSYYEWGVFFFEDHIIKTGANDQDCLPEYSNDITDIVCANTELSPGKFDIDDSEVLELFNFCILPTIKEWEGET